MYPFPDIQPLERPARLTDMEVQQQLDVPVRERKIGNIEIFCPKDSSMVVQINHKGERIGNTRGFIVGITNSDNQNRPTVVVDYEYPGLCAYTSMYDAIFLGEKAIQQLKNQSQIVPIFLRHELSHRHHYWLDKNQQEQLTDLFLSNDLLRTYLHEFAVKRYQDTYLDFGARALESDSVTNMGKDMVFGVEPGMKDTRSALIHMNENGEDLSTRVFLFNIVSELMAYGNVVLLDSEILAEYVKFEQDRRQINNLPEHIIIAMQVIKYIYGEKRLRDHFEEFGIFKDIDAELNL